MRKLSLRLIFAPLLLALSMGATDCDSFSDVTVPASDTSPPVTFDGVWLEGDYVELESSSTADAITYHAPPGQVVLAISAGMDSGGLRRLTMTTEVGWTCCQGNICSSTTSLSAPIIETQTGGVGATVSDGIYTGVGFGNTTPTCNSGFTLKSQHLAWRTTAENFHGGKTTSKLHRIISP